MSIYLGIDPGANGAAAAVDDDGTVVSVCRFKNETDESIASWVGEWGWLDDDALTCCVERVWSRPGQGVASTFKFGLNYGFLLGCLTTSEIPYGLVLPAVWQKKMNCLTGGDKNVTKRAAKLFWPGRKITHADADALLLAEYCRLLNTEI